MKKDSDKINLTAKETAMLGVQSAIQAIPYVGSSIATLYFGYKQEIRFKRLEAFYENIAKEIEDLKEEIKQIDEQDKDYFLSLFEELNEKIEQEISEKKIIFLKNFFKNTLIYPVSSKNHDERFYFLNLIKGMTILEFEILFFINRINVDRAKHTKTLNFFEKKSGIDKSVTIGAITRLISYGFITQNFSSDDRFQRYEDGSQRLQDTLNMTDFGKKYIRFISEPIK